MALTVRCIARGPSMFANDLCSQIQGARRSIAGISARVVHQVQRIRVGSSLKTCEATGARAFASSLAALDLGELRSWPLTRGPMALTPGPPGSLGSSVTSAAKDAGAWLRDYVTAIKNGR